MKQKHEPVFPRPAASTVYVFLSCRVSQRVICFRLVYESQLEYRSYLLIEHLFFILVDLRLFSVMSENVPAIQESLRVLLLHIKETKAKLELFGDQSMNDCSSELSSHEAAKLRVSLAYTLASLYFIMKNVQGGGSTSDEGITMEINRIKGYVVKLNSVSKESTSSQSAKLDSRASKRMIEHHLSENSR
jgi:hypothetical protein